MDYLRRQLVLLPRLGRLDLLVFRLGQFVFHLLNGFFKRCLLIFQQFLGARSVKDVHRLGIRQANEGLLNFFKLGHVPAKKFQVRPMFFQNFTDDGADKVFRQIQQVRQIGKSDFRLDHPEFRQVPAGLGLLSAERRTETINFSQRHRRRFQIKLAGLCQIHRLTEIIDFKQRLGALTGAGSKDRGIDEGKTIIVEKFPDGENQRVANSHNGRLPRGPQPQMTKFQQKFNPVLFRRNRKIRCAVNHPGIFDRQFVTARRTRFGSHRPRHRQ